MGNQVSGFLEAQEEDEFYQMIYGGSEGLGNNEYQGHQSDTED